MSDFTSLWITFGAWFYDLLPNSPFIQFKDTVSSTIQPYVKWLNWFFPVDWILTLMSVWLVAIGSFYMVQAVGRWLKALGS